MEIGLYWLWPSYLQPLFQFWLTAKVKKILEFRGHELVSLHREKPLFMMKRKFYLYKDYSEIFGLYMIFLVPLVKYFKWFSIIFVIQHYFHTISKYSLNLYMFFFLWLWIIFDRITTSESWPFKGQSPLNDLDTKFAIAM